MAIRNLLNCRLLFRQAGLMIILLTLAVSLGGVINITLSSVEAVNGQEVELSLNADGTAFADIYSLYLKLEYDPEALQLLQVSHGSALPGSWTTPLFSQSMPQSIASYGTVPIVAMGQLLKLRFALIGNVQAVFPIQISHFNFNEGLPTVEIQSGSISAFNRIPSLNPIPDQSGAENQFMSFDLQGYDPQSLPLEILALSIPNGGQLISTGNGSARFEWTPAYNQAGSYNLSFGVFNSQGYGDTLNVQVQIDQRIAVSIPFSSAMPGEYVNIPIYGEDFSGMNVYSVFARIGYNPQLLSYHSIVQTGTLSSSWAAPAVTNNGNQITISLYGTSPLSGSGVIYYLRMLAVGPLYTRAYLTFNNLILNEGDPAVQSTGGFSFIGGPEPWFDAVAPITISEGELLNLALQANDPRDLPMQISALSIPQTALFEAFADNSANLMWQSGYFDQGTYELVFSATNSLGYTAVYSVNLTVLNVPVSPIVIYPLAQISFDEDTPYNALNLFDIFDDGDLAVGDELSFACVPNPYLEVLIDDGAVSIIPLADWFGSTSLVFSATDLDENSVSHSIQITVNPVNDVPRILQELPSLEMPEDHPGISLDLSEYVYDVEADLLAYQVTGAQNLIVSINGNILHIAPQADWFGQRNCVLVVSEVNTTELHSIQMPFTVVVHPINDAPIVLATMPTVTMMYNTSFITASMEEYFADVDSPLSYSLYGTTNIAVSLISENRISITPIMDWYGTEYLTVRATDDSLAWVEQSFRISVIRDFMMQENFDHAGSLPTGWTVNTVSGSANWVPLLISGTNYAMQVQNPTASPVNAYRLVSQAYNLSAFKNIEVGFAYNFQGANSSAIFQYSTTGITWNNVATMTPNTSGYVLYSLPAAQQQSNIRFRWSYQTTSLLPNLWRVDDFTITGVYGDFVRPSTINDLQIVGANTNSVSLAWTPCNELYFDRYEIVYSTDSIINTQDPIWSINQDPALGFINTASTTITGLQNDTGYWFMIRGVDTSANQGLNSNVVTTTLNMLPLFHSPYPPAGIFHNSRSVELGISASDDVMLNAATLQYRADINGNGIYDSDEVWTPISGYTNAPQLEIRTMVTFATDSDDLRYEFRIKDMVGLQYVYSGTQGSLGIADDYSIIIDSTAPSAVSDLRCIDATASSVQLAWSQVTELHFASYEVHYSTSVGVTWDAFVWNAVQYPALAQINTQSTIVTGLIPGQRYWFRISAIDMAGNRSQLSNEVTNVPHSVLPVFDDPHPIQNAAWQNSRSIEIGTRIYDAYGIDLSRIQYRYDANGNGVYDAEEAWATVTNIIPGRSDEGIIVRALCNFSVDAAHLAFEFRAWDIDNYGPAYSGNSQSIGIADDWYVSIDTVNPTTASSPIAQAISESSIQIAWNAASDLNFRRYEIYYSNTPDVGLQSSLWTDSEDHNLANPGNGVLSTTIAGLQISTRYYFKIRVVDLAGNDSWSDEVFATTHGAYAPATPSNFRLQIVGNDVVLEWDPVLYDTAGHPINVMAYLIYGSTDPYFSADFGSLLDITDQNYYVFEDIAAFIDYVFFSVSAIDSIDELRTIQALPKSRINKPE